MAPLFLGAFNRAEMEESKMWKRQPRPSRIDISIERLTDLHLTSTLYTAIHNPILAPSRIIIR